MKNEINIEIMSVVELESLAYRLLVQIQNLQNNLQVVNNKIAEKSKAEVIEPEVFETKSEE